MSQVSHCPTKSITANDWLRVMDCEYMAYSMDIAWVEQDVGYAVGYTSPLDRGVVYLFPEMKWTRGNPPGVGTISVSVGMIDHDRLSGLNQNQLRQQTRFRALGDGKYEAGYFEPSIRIFFRWRGVIKKDDDIYFDPEMEAIPYIVPPGRISVIVDIDPPKDAE